ncbi:hypothetical protein GCM10010503_10940 [Streptomyces lucensis JCM 4490]|uniref:GH26 domain-containing protein n=1 Tax=Streptomyces lucensis JCM 4490 TaxID=1306176 RepID=A0A918IX22_9ACTN|nr:glycosyl hydrolase [Streptomyces lucensis]GGW36831.1 hypothetical protein GCM10010503_10940 [Streptomyces lucensis JCM 4490]
MAPQQRRDRVRRRVLVSLAAVAVSVALAAGPGRAAGVAPAAAGPPAPTPTSPARTESGVPPFGAFLDSGPLGVVRMSELSRWLGGTDLKVAHTYLPGGRWRDIEGRPGFLDHWARWRLQKADRTLVLNVPMQERNEEGLSDAEVRGLLRQAASGAFDDHFRTLAERLVRLGVPDTVIVLGWEMNGTTYSHRCGPDPQAWKTYWDRIVTTMRSVPGQRFRFDFTPSRGLDAVPWTECYPGDDTVDIIGMDSYDQPAGLSFDEQVTEPYGLQQHVDFAKAHGKPISYPEWGLFRNGDDAEYMSRMLAWIDEHEPLYNTLTDYCPHGVWQCAQNPRSAQVYRAALYDRTGPATPAPTPTPDGTPTPPSAPATTPVPAPTSSPAPASASSPAPEATPEAAPTATPKPPAGCSPPDLDDWTEFWLAGRHCTRLDWWSPGH